MFRGKFHSKYILLAEKNMINENELYKQEEEWLRSNEEFLTDADIIRQTMKNYAEDVEEYQGTSLGFAGGLFFGLIFHLFLILLLIFIKPRSTRFMRGAYLGTFLSIFFLLLAKAVDII